MTETLPTDPNPPLPQLGVGSLLSQTFGLFFARFRTLFPLAFVPLLLLQLAALGLPWPTIPPTDPASPVLPSLSLPWLVFGALSFVLQFLLLGFVCLAAMDAVLGRTRTIDQNVRQAARQMLPLIVLAIWLSVMIGVGMILFILPGLYLAARFLPWVEAVVFEEKGWSGLGRAKQLTKGYRWPLLGAMLLLGLIFILAQMGLVAFYGVPISPSADFVAVPSMGWRLVIGVVAAAATGAFLLLGCIFTALAYVRLRMAHEQVTPAEIAAGAP